jgi:hypothetical protein
MAAVLRFQKKGARRAFGQVPRIPSLSGDSRRVLQEAGDHHREAMRSSVQAPLTAP